MVKSLAFQIMNGWRPNPDRYRTIAERINRLVDSWIADPKLSPIPDQDFIEALFEDRFLDRIKWTPTHTQDGSAKYNRPDLPPLPVPLKTGLDQPS